MSLYLVKADVCDWDQFDSFIIKANTKEDAEKIAIDFINQEIKFNHASDEPQNWTAEKITINSLPNGIIHSSFNAG